MALNPLVESRKDLEKNIQTVEAYLRDRNTKQFDEMSGYIQRGACFIVYKNDDGRFAFVPSKFIGHLDNTLNKHAQENFYGGGETNNKISRILGEMQSENSELEEWYIQYCHHLGAKPSARIRRYWVSLLNKLGDSIELEY